MSEIFTVAISAVAGIISIAVLIKIALRRLRKPRIIVAPWDTPHQLSSIHEVLR